MKLQNETNIHGRWYDDACVAAFALELVGERWALLIVRELMLGGRRFSDIRASLPGISAKVLTERLEKLEAVGIVAKRKLPPPASAQLYELTQWGRELEEVMQALGRWSVRSPLHDPRLPLSPVAFMLSLRTMFDRDRAAGFALFVRFEIGEEAFVAEVLNGGIAVRRAGPDDDSPQLVFRAASSSHLLPVLYGKKPVGGAGAPLQIEGDAGLAARFVDLFHRPEKVRAGPAE